MESLTSIDISGNTFENLEEIKNLIHLENLTIENSNLKTLIELSKFLPNLRKLKKLNLKNNPVCKEKNFYLETIGLCREYI